MELPQQGKRSPEEIEVLNQAFRAFTEATEKLQGSYDNLKEQVKTLDLELEEKNLALEKNLAEKEEVKNYLHNILESLTTGVIVVDREGTVTTVNATAGQLTGREPQTCLGKPLVDLFESDLLSHLVHRVNKTGRSLGLEREFRGQPGTATHLRISASQVLNPARNPIGTVLILQDTTQLRLLEQEAQRNQRLRSMGEMAAGIAHEIRNPLASIELFAALLKKDLSDDEEKHKLVEHIRSGVKNMDRTISAFLLFAKSPKPSRQKCDMKALLSGLLDHSPDLQIPPEVHVLNTWGKGDLLAAGDDELLRRVFLNLLRNAVQAMPDGGNLELAVQESTPENHDGPPDHRRFIAVSITDSGQGILADHREKIFDPFFSTKDKGTGLGLSICHNIIKAHQGTIEVTSDAGQTTFLVKIPSWDNEFDQKQF